MAIAEETRRIGDANLKNAHGSRLWRRRTVGRTFLYIYGAGVPGSTSLRDLARRRHQPMRGARRVRFRLPPSGNEHAAAEPINHDVGFMLTGYVGSR
jgi:hypothetical protein